MIRDLEHVIVRLLSNEWQQYKYFNYLDEKFSQGISLRSAEFPWMIIYKPLRCEGLATFD